MDELVCIVCPRGCTLRAEREGGVIRVEGNGCRRGADFARTELTAPMRTLCTTVRTVFPQAPVLPVKLSAEIPKDRIFLVMKAVNAVTLDRPVGLGGAEPRLLLRAHLRGRPDGLRAEPGRPWAGLRRGPHHHPGHGAVPGPGQPAPAGHHFVAG